jgi:ABC transport system ATP-binding/permease protein
MPPEQPVPYVRTEVVRDMSVSDLAVMTRRSAHTLSSTRTYRVGRNPESDILVDDTRVSWTHGVFRVDGDRWIFEDAGSTNGTFVGAQKTQRVDISADCVIKLGNPNDGPIMRCTPQGARTPQDAQAAPAVAPHPAAPPRVAAHAPAPQPASPPRAAAPAPQPSPAAPRPPAVAPWPGSGQGGAAAQEGAAFLPSVDRRPTARMRLPAKVMRIGRTPDNDIVLNGDPVASRHHAELRKSPTGGYEIVDLSSHNGTYVNGEKVTRKALSDRDIVSIGHSTFRLAGGELRQFVDDGVVTFAAQDLVVKVSGGKILLDHVTFPIPEKSLVGVIGPSGAGKSTLLGALTGMRPADTGTVLYDNRDLYREYAELRHRIGLVPQESVLHIQLTAKRALQYTAELRFPADTSSGERETRVDEVMGELGLTKHARTRADRLSGGQLKRVNVAQELLTKPSLLFLDEPTSGLDPGLDKSVMEQMRDLAHEGRTVIVVTHSVANLDTCDRLLVLVPGGKIAFYGPPKDGLRYFGLKDWADVFQAFERYPDRNWAAEFARSPAYQQYVLQQNPAAGRVKPGAAGGQMPAPPARRGAVRQLMTLTRRYTQVTASDRGTAVGLALLPIILGALVHFVPASEGLTGRPGTNGNAGEILTLVVVCVCMACGIFAVRELVKERAIYIRERAAGLSSGAYLWSKLLLLGVVTVVQVIVLDLLILVGRPMPAKGAVLGSPLLEIIVATVVLGLCSMCLALLLSALVGTSERGMLLAIGTSAFQIILSGGVFALNGMTGLSQIAWLAPARWGFAAVASTVNLNVIQPPGVGSDPLWRHSSSVWLKDTGIMAGLALVFALLAYLRMRRLSPGRRR